jgi:hypothetical protein
MWKQCVQLKYSFFLRDTSARILGIRGLQKTSFQTLNSNFSATNIPKRLKRFTFIDFPKIEDQARCSLADRVRVNWRKRNFGCLSFEIIKTRSKQTQNVLRASNISSYQAAIATTPLKNQMKIRNIFFSVEYRK